MPTCPLQPLSFSFNSRWNLPTWIPITTREEAGERKLSSHRTYVRWGSNQSLVLRLSINYDGHGQLYKLSLQLSLLLSQRLLCNVGIMVCHACYAMLASWCAMLAWNYTSACFSCLHPGLCHDRRSVISTHMYTFHVNIRVQPQSAYDIKLYAQYCNSLPMISSCTLSTATVCLWYQAVRSVLQQSAYDVKLYTQYCNSLPMMSSRTLSTATVCLGYTAMYMASRYHVEHSMMITQYYSQNVTSMCTA